MRPSVSLLRALGGAALIGVMSFAPSAQKAARALKAHTNVLVIVLDDLGTDKLEFYAQTPPDCPTTPCAGPPNCAPLQTGCVGPYPATPNLDQLRKQGIWFTRAYATPFCSPSRACIQTGRFGFRTGVGHLTSTLSIPGTFELPNNEKLLAELLRDGFARPGLGLPYACAAFGKWHLSTTLASDRGHAVENGYERFYGSVGNLANFFRYDKVVHDVGSAPGLQPMDGSVTQPPFGTDTWHASVTSRDALEWIDAQEDSFLAYVAFSPPHRPFQVPPAALLSASTLCDLECAGLQPGDFGVLTDPPELLRLVYHAMVEAVDAEIGNLIEGIDPRKRENTMIFVIGDNGTSEFVIDDPPHDADHAKGYVYEWGIRVPLIVSGPLVKAPIPIGGWQSDALVSAVDLWRTIAAITGADASRVVALEELDSLSFLPVIREPTSAGNRTLVFSQLFAPNGVVPLPPPSCYSQNQRSTSDGVYKYVRTQEAVAPHPCGVPTYSEELYLLAGDPEETTDLIGGTLTAGESAALNALRAAMDGLSGL